jgi:integrase
MEYAVPIRKLSKSVVEKIEPLGTDVVVWDEALPGFGVRVKPSGVRSYVVQYRNRLTGASKRMTIGQHGPLLSFEQAKRQARTILTDAMRGLDPAEAQRSARGAPTVRNLADDYVERHAVPNKRPKGIKDDRAMLEKVVLPKLGKRKVAEITRRDIEALHITYVDRPYRANRVLALLSKMFNLAIEWGWRLDNPARGVKRFQEEKRDRWLSDQELERLWSVLENHPNRRAANAIQLQLLTGARLGEVLSARREAFDLERGVWTKPSHQTKQRKTEYVPLSPQALDLVASILGEQDTDELWLFPGNVPGQPLKDLKKFWSGVMEEAGIEGYRRHDNRHTYASHLVSDGLSLEVVGRLLGHTSPETTKRYAHLADDPLRRATELFGAKVGKSNGR